MTSLIALAILCVSGQLQQIELDGVIFVGELALDGTLRPIKGAINVAETAKSNGFERIYLPESNAEQASLIDGIEIIAVGSIKQLFLHLKGEVPIEPYIKAFSAIIAPYVTRAR